MAYQFTQTGAEIQDILDLARNDIAAEYDPTASYVAGDYCTYEDSMYKCTGATTGTFAPAKWSAVTAGDEINSLNATLTNMTASGTWTPVIVGANVSSVDGDWYRVGNIVHLRGQVYFTSSQTDQGNIYIDMNSLPTPAKNKIIFGMGMYGGGMLTVASNMYINSNIFFAFNGAFIKATSANVSGGRIRFSLIAGLSA